MKRLLILIFALNSVYNYSQSYDYNQVMEECRKSTQDLIHFEKIKAFNKCISGIKAPNFIGTSITGESIELNSLKGNIVVLNFWFLACPPCIAEIPGLNDLVKKYEEDNIVFLSITRDSEKEINTFFKGKKPFLFKTIPDNVDIFRNIYLLNYFPTTIIIDKEGFIRYLTMGGGIGETASDEIKQELIPVIRKYLRK